MDDFENDLINGGTKVDFYEQSRGIGKSAEAFSIEAQRKDFLGGSGDRSSNEANITKEAKATLLPLDEVKSHVLRWSDPNVSKQYADAARPLYRAEQVDTPEGKRETMIRIGLMNFTHTFQESGQTIHNIGTQHDKNPTSEMNRELRKKVQDYIAITPPEQRYFMLEGWNIPEGQELPQEYKEILESFKQQEGETEEQASKRVVERIGEQGVGLYYAMKLGISIDLHTEIPQEKEIEAFKKEGIAESDIAAFLLPKYLDIYKQGNEFKPEDKLTQQQMFEAITRVVKSTGWKKQEFDSLIPDKQSDFIANVIEEANTVTQREIGKEILTSDYQPQYRFANELMSYRDKSQVLTKMFNIGNDARDLHVTERAYKAVQEGKSPFLIFGDSHTFKIDPALEYMTSRKKIDNDNKKAA